MLLNTTHSHIPTPRSVTGCGHLVHPVVFPPYQRPKEAQALTFPALHASSRPLQSMIQATPSASRMITAVNLLLTATLQQTGHKPIRFPHRSPPPAQVSTLIATSTTPRPGRLARPQQGNMRNNTPHHRAMLVSIRAMSPSRTFRARVLRRLSRAVALVVQVVITASRWRCDQ
jgi:hypothetical protein